MHIVRSYNRHNTTQHNTTQHTKPHCISNIRKLSYSTTSSRCTHWTPALPPFLEPVKNASGFQPAGGVSPLCVVSVTGMGRSSSSDSLSKSSSWTMSSSLQTYLKISSTSNTILLEIQFLGTCVASWLLATGRVYSYQQTELFQHCGVTTNPPPLLYTEPRLKLLKVKFITERQTAAETVLVNWMFYILGTGQHSSEVSGA